MARDGGVSGWWVWGQIIDRTLVFARSSVIDAARVLTLRGYLAVLIEVADGGAFGPELVGGPDFLEGVKELSGSSKRRNSRQDNSGQENSYHAIMLGRSAGGGQAG